MTLQKERFKLINVYEGRASDRMKQVVSGGCGLMNHWILQKYPYRLTEGKLICLQKVFPDLFFFSVILTLH